MKRISLRQRKAAVTPTFAWLAANKRDRGGACDRFREELARFHRPPLLEQAVVNRPFMFRVNLDYRALYCLDLHRCQVRRRDAEDLGWTTVQPKDPITND